MTIKVPKLSLVALIGASGSGKSTFARKHFLPTEVISSDYCRAILADDENDQAVTDHAFELLHAIVDKRLALGRLAVVDATNVQEESRKPLIRVARDRHAIPVAIVFDLPEKVCVERNRLRTDRKLGPRVVGMQRAQLRRSLRRLEREGFRHVFVLRSEEEIEAAAVERVPLWCDRRELRGPFDVIGDVHGCCDELETLLDRLGYRPAPQGEDPVWGWRCYAHPLGRMAVFLGDLADRGPRILDAIRLARNMVKAGCALCVPGNHDLKLVRALAGKDVRITHGLERSLAEIESVPEEGRQTLREGVRGFLDKLVSHYVLDEGKLVVAHAGMKEELQGRGSGKVREFALYGETTGETDEFGLPVRYNWAAEYRGQAMVVYGHTPVPEPEWLNRTINIDTGCVFGGALTALRYPERELVSVPAAREYAVSARPLAPSTATLAAGPGLTAQQAADDLLDIEDVIGKRRVETRLRSVITIREENAIPALEVMTRFAVNPKWLIYLPPTMSPCETSQEPGLLEHPAEAFAYYRSQGIPRVICETKHMGSRAVAVICRDEETARGRFGIAGAGAGMIYTRTGRRFFGTEAFDGQPVESTLLERLRSAFGKAGLWEELHTDWACLDCEVMPWSEKARELLRGQYAAVGAAARASFGDVLPALERLLARTDLDTAWTAPAESSTRPVGPRDLLDHARRRSEMAGLFIEAYRRYSWPVKSIEDYKIAPFHLLATEGAAHVEKDHEWHLTMLRKLAEADRGIIIVTPHRVVDVTDPQSEAAGCRWWTELTARGDEGMVVKPHSFIAKGRQGIVQPAVKVRGREYLRIIYGPEYTAEENLSRLRQRGLGAKRSLAMREFALGVEALERFVRREPLRRVHECVFGVLALESEPVDPRL
jgi:polynucleotide kinase-phosphatase